MRSVRGTHQQITHDSMGDLFVVKYCFFFDNNCFQYLIGTINLLSFQTVENNIQ